MELGHPVLAEGTERNGPLLTLGNKLHNTYGPSKPNNLNSSGSSCVVNLPISIQAGFWINYDFVESSCEPCT